MSTNVIPLKRAPEFVQCADCNRTFTLFHKLRRGEKLKCPYCSAPSGTFYRGCEDVSKEIKDKIALINKELNKSTLTDEFEDDF